MFLSVMTLLFVGPAICIYGIKVLIDEIVKACRGDNNSTDSNTNNYNVHYETAEEERRRTNKYGYDDERWGKL